MPASTLAIFAIRPERAITDRVEKAGRRRPLLRLVERSFVTDITPILVTPEPSSVWLLAMGLVALATRRERTVPATVASRSPI